MPADRSLCKKFSYLNSLSFLVFGSELHDLLQTIVKYNIPKLF